MIRVAIGFVLALFVALLSWGIINNTYDHSTFASQEAQESLEVTEEQSRELTASRLTSDMIAFGLFSALLAGTTGAFAGSQAHPKQAALAGGAGVLIGLAFGVVSAYLGHWHDANVAFTGGDMTYWFVRWLLLLAPIGIASALAARIGSRSKTVDKLVGGVLGAAIAAVVYCLASGSVTALEGHQDIFPATSGNRALALVLAAVCIITALTMESKKKLPQPADVSELDSE